MHLLLPKFTFMQTTLYLVALFVCWFYGDTPSSEVLYTIDPATALLLAGVYAGTKGAEQIVKGVQAKKAAKELEGSPEFKALKREGDQARKRLKTGDYGKTDTEIEKGVGEARRTYEADTKKALADVTRGGQDPFSAGRKKQLADLITGGLANTAATTRTQQQALSAQQARDERAADLSTIQQGAASRQALLQQRAAANTAIAGGVATTAGSGIQMGTQMAASGLLTPVDKTGLAGTVAGQYNQQNTPAPVNPIAPAGAPKSA